MLHKPCTIYILILLYASYTTLLSADEHAHTDTADRYETKICIPTSVKNTLDTSYILAIIVTSMQKYIPNPDYCLYNTHNYTLSKILLRFRGGIPEDVYTPAGWYLPSWATFYLSREGYNAMRDYCIKEEHSDKKRIPSFFCGGINDLEKKELRKALFKRLAVKRYQKDIYEITGIQP